MRDIEVPAGRVKCVVVNYRPLPPLPKSPCPFPVNISAPQQVTDGEIITYTADVSYSGTAALKYKWKVTPSSARIISGLGTADAECRLHRTWRTAHHRDVDCRRWIVRSGVRAKCAGSFDHCAAREESDCGAGV